MTVVRGGVTSNGVKASSGNGVRLRDVGEDGLLSSGQNGVGGVNGRGSAGNGQEQNGYANGQDNGRVNIHSNGRPNVYREPLFDYVEEVPIPGGNLGDNPNTIDAPAEKVCANGATQRRLFLHGAMMSVSLALTEEPRAEAGAAILLSTGSNARNVARRVVSLSEGWMTQRAQIELVDYEAVTRANGRPTSMAQRLDGACMVLAEAQKECDGKLVDDGVIPTWLIIDLLDLAPGLSVDSTSHAHVDESTAQPVGTNGLNWLELLEVFAWQRTRCTISPHILILAQPLQRDEISECLQQFTSLRGVPFYVASPLDGTGRILKPDVWQTQLAGAIAGLMWRSEQEADEIGGDGWSVGIDGRAQKNQTVCALGSVAHFAPTDLIKAWLGVCTVESLLGQGMQDAVAEYLLPSRLGDEAAQREPDVQAAIMVAQSVEADGLESVDFDIRRLPILSIDDLEMSTSMIQTRVPQNPSMHLVEQWQAGEHHADTPAKDLLMKVQGELAEIGEQQYRGRRSWLMDQLSIWEQELYLWSAAMLMRSGEGAHFASYENALQSIWQALVHVAALIEEKLADAGDVVSATSEILKTQMDAVDASCERWSATATRLGDWRFVRPDYGWLWWRSRSFVLPRQLEALSDAHAAHNNARLSEANLHVMRQLCLAQMQDVRLQLYRAEELMRWFGGLRSFLGSCQSEIEASLGSMWTSSALQGLWQAMQSDTERAEERQKFDIWLQEKPLIEWLQVAPTELYAQAAAVVEPWLDVLDETNVLDLLMMANANEAEEAKSAWLDAFVAQGEVLWPREDLAVDGRAQHYLLTPPIRVEDGSVDESIGDLQKRVEAWCERQPNVEQVESRLEGLLIVYAAATDLEGLWL